MRSLGLDLVAGQQFELSAVKTLKDHATPLAQKLTLSTLTAATFTQDVSVTVPTSGDKQPDPFTLDLAGGANVEVNDISLDLPGGPISILELLTLTRNADGSLSAKLKTDLDFDPYIGQPLVLYVQLSVAGQSYTRKITLNAQLQDRPTQLDAPKLLVKDDGDITVENAIADPDGVRTVLYILYADAVGKTETARNSSGIFTGLSANTAYYAGATAEALDRSSNKWTAQKSPLLPVTTDQAMPAAFSFNPVSGANLGAQYPSNAISVSGLHSAAAISIRNGEYALDG